MAADSTQIRISKVLSARLGVVANRTTDPKFTKEQLLAMFISECVEAVESPEPVVAVVPSILSLRKNLKLPLPSDYLAERLLRVEKALSEIQQAGAVQPSAAKTQSSA